LQVCQLVVVPDLDKVCGGRCRSLTRRTTVLVTAWCLNFCTVTQTRRLLEAELFMDLMVDGNSGGPPVVSAKNVRVLARLPEKLQGRVEKKRAA
jgi:hypothetical protein